LINNTGMHIYFSGIGGIGIGPLAQLAKDSGHEVSGSDIERNSIVEDLEANNITVAIGQNKKTIAELHHKNKIDWFVHSSAIKKDNEEYKFAMHHSIRISKRDELLNMIVEETDLKLVAIAGTHGKSSTTSMIIWILNQLKIPFSYSVGAELSFGPSAQYIEGSEFFVYEADEFDKNFLHFKPHIATITTIDYDHPDTYPTRAEYVDSYRQFINQSELFITWDFEVSKNSIPLKTSNKSIVLGDNAKLIEQIGLPGLHNRQNASLAITTVKEMIPGASVKKLVAFATAFPGAKRRFEELDKRLYSDYAHHPDEIRATIQMAREKIEQLSKFTKKKIGLTVLYQPHQNVRQHELHENNGYEGAFDEVDKLYWLPTYLSREKPGLALLTPAQLTDGISHPKKIELSHMNKKLIDDIKEDLKSNLVLCMAAGDLDEWARVELVD